MVNRLGAIEGGGTKFLCAVGDGPHRIEAQVRIPTTTFEETIASVLAFFRAHPVQALGVAMFGPIELRRGGKLPYGTVLRTPKTGWTHAPLGTHLAAGLNIPVVVDTDVNAAALAEARWGAGVGMDPLVYVTVGTGIGGGILVHGRPVHGLMHPELGHMLIPRQFGVDGRPDSTPSVCPFHENCLEGLASGPALERRMGVKGDRAAEDHPAWQVEAAYLACGLANIALTLSPERIVVGGGVFDRPFLLGRVQGELVRRLGGYVERLETLEHVEDYVVASKLRAPGLAGAFALVDPSSFEAEGPGETPR